MIDDDPPMTVVRVGDGAESGDLELDVAVTSVGVETPEALFDTLAERRVGCVVLAPDGAGWDAIDVLAAIQEHTAAGTNRPGESVPVVLVTAGDLSAYVDAGVLSAIAGVVRPDDGAVLRERVRDVVAAARERETGRQARDSYRTLVEESPAPIAILDDDGSIQFANEALATLLAVDTPGELVGRDALSFVASEEREPTGEWVRRVIEGGEAAPAARRTLVDATGDRKTVVASMQRVVVDGQTTIQVLLNDVTEHERLQRRLREERDRVATLFENLNEPVVETRFEDDEPVVTAANDAFAATFGVDRDAIVGQPLDDIIVPAAERERASAINHRAKAGEHVEVEVSRQTPEGPREFLLRFAPYERADGAAGGEGGDDGSDAAAGGYAIYVDITERSEWERQLRRQNERLEEVAAVVSHDLRNPLNVAHGTVDVLASDADESEREHFERVQRAHERMEAIIDDMLALARHGQSVSEKAPVDLARVARAAWETTGTADATLAIETDVTVLADESRLQGALENLFANAVDHAGPDVTVRVGTLPDGTGFFVADDGPGIPEREREDVFESGFSSADQGIGFGLSIVRSIVEAHGWDVAVAEDSDGGARFQITGVEFDE